MMRHSTVVAEHTFDPTHLPSRLRHILIYIYQNFPNARELRAKYDMQILGHI